MTSIGDQLRRERQRRNLELPKIAGELKISVRFLEAIEQDEFGKLPGGVFTKSFVRQYASFLGLDGDEVAAELEHTVEPEPDVSQLSDTHKPDVPGIEIEMGEESWQSVRERRAPLPSWLRAGVLLVVLMLVCSGVYWWWQRPRRPVLAHETTPPSPSNPVAQTSPSASPSAPSANRAATPLSPSAPPPAPPPTQTAGTPAPVSTASATIPAPGAQTSAETQAKPVETAAAPEIPISAPNPNATVRIAITADEQVWVRADVNGKYQFSGTLQPHESRNIDVDGQVVLRLGNAGGATITLNGKPVGAVGPKGQIRTVQFTSGGFQIVSPAKSLDPPDRL